MLRMCEGVDCCVFWPVECDGHGKRLVVCFVPRVLASTARKSCRVSAFSAALCVLLLLLLLPNHLSVFESLFLDAARMGRRRDPAQELPRRSTLPRTRSKRN